MSALTTPMIGAALLGLALLTPTTAATAAGEICRGEAATIVGTTPTLTGTEGRDVIVTGTATSVEALGGDDLVCVTGGGNTNQVSVNAGLGNDVVDTTSATLNSHYIESDLGPGADTLEGGPGGDWVDTGDETGSAAEVDVVRSGAGDDFVTTSGGSDVIDLGPGNNVLRLDGPGTTPEGRLAGGDGYDTFTARVDDAGTFNMAAGTYASAGGTAQFSSFEALYVEAHGADLTYSGTEGADYVTVETYGPEPTTLVADTSGGDDRINLDRTLLGPGSRIDAGAGDDGLVAARTSGNLALDLGRARLRVQDDTFPATGLEDAFLMARTVSLAGDEQDNTLSVLACRSTITGGHGDDELLWQGDYVFEDYSFSCTKSSTMRGGAGKDFFHGDRGDDRMLGGGGADLMRGQAGDDRLRGGSGADKLFGGTGDDDVRGGGGADKLFGDDGRDRLVGEGGRDLADGGKGRDTCAAEKSRRCKR